MKDCNLDILTRYKDILPEEDIQKVIGQVAEYRDDGGNLFGPEVQALKSRLMNNFRRDVHMKIYEKIDAKRMKDWANNPDFVKVKDSPKFKKILGDLQSKDPKVREKAQKQFMKSGVLDPILAKTSGLSTKAEGGNIHYERVKERKAGEYIQIIEQGLDESELKTLMNGEFDVEIAKAVEEINMGKSISSSNPDIQKAAKAMQKLNKAIYKDLSEVGVWINEAENYITKQTHDINKISDVGFSEWTADILKPGVLNEVKTFGKKGLDPKEKTKILKQIHSDMLSNQYGRAKAGSYTGTREIHFLNAESFAKYNKKYGRGSLLETVSESLQAAAKHYSRTRMFGVNASKNVKVLKESIEKGLPEEAKVLLNQGFGERSRVGKELNEIMGEANYDASVDKIVQGLQTARVVQAGTKLTFSVFTTSTDVALGRFYQTAGFDIDFAQRLKAVPEFMKNFFSKKYRKESEALTGMYFSDMAELSDRYGAFAGGGGKIAKFYRKYVLPLNLMQKQNAAAKLTWAKTQMFSMGREVELGWKELDPRLQDTMTRYGIKEKDWSILQKAKEEVDGVPLVGPDSILKAGGSKELADNYAIAMNDMAKHSSPDVGIRERALVAQGFKRGTRAREVMATLMQFKSFPLTMTRILERTLNNNPNIDARGFKELTRSALQNRGEIKMLGMAMAEMTVLSAMSQMSRDALTKGEITDLSNPEAVRNLMMDSAQKAALPLMTTMLIDIARGEYAKFGRSMIKDLVGLTAADVDKMVRVLSGVADKDSETFLQGSQLILQYLPGQQLTQIAPLGMKSFLQQLKEIERPGYMERLEKRKRKEGKIRPDIINPFR